MQAAVLCARHTTQDSFVLLHSVKKDKRSLQGVGGVDCELLLFSESCVLFEHLLRGADEPEKLLSKKDEVKVGDIFFGL